MLKQLRLKQRHAPCLLQKKLYLRVPRERSPERLKSAEVPANHGAERRGQDFRQSRAYRHREELADAAPVVIRWGAPEAVHGRGTGLTVAAATATVMDTTAVSIAAAARNNAGAAACGGVRRGVDEHGAVGLEPEERAVRPRHHRAAACLVRLPLGGGGTARPNDSHAHGRQVGVVDEKAGTTIDAAVAATAGLRTIRSRRKRANRAEWRKSRSLYTIRRPRRRQRRHGQ